MEYANEGEVKQAFKKVKRDTNNLRTGLACVGIGVIALALFTLVRLLV